MSSHKSGWKCHNCSQSLCGRYVTVSLPNWMLLIDELAVVDCRICCRRCNCRCLTAFPHPTQKSEGDRRISRPLRDRVQRLANPRRHVDAGRRSHRTVQRFSGSLFLLPVATRAHVLSLLRVQQMTQENSTCTLLIKQTFLEDSGVLTCRVKNGLGEAKASAELVVVPKNK